MRKLNMMIYEKVTEKQTKVKPFIRCEEALPQL